MAPLGTAPQALTTHNGPGSDRPGAQSNQTKQILKTGTLIGRKLEKH